MRRRALLLSVLLAGQARAQDLTPLELNSASRAELESLTGIGPDLAERLLAARPFKDWRDLRRRVAGIGPKLAAKLSAQGLRVQGQAWNAQAASATAPATKG